MTMQAKEKDGNYVRSIVAMMNDADPASPSPPWVSPSRESTPPRNAPSYLSVSKSNNGYNNTLLYSVAHHRDIVKEKEEPSPPHVNGNGVKASEKTLPRPEDSSPSQYVSLSQMIAPKPRNHSKYSDLGLQLKSPEKNCRSFLRNISSFEMIGKQGPSVRSPETTVTMVGQKMQHMLHLDSPAAKAAATEEAKPEPAKPSVPSESVDLTDRALPAQTPHLTSQTADCNSLNHREGFSVSILKIVGAEEPEECFEPPPVDLAGEHFRKIATEHKERLLKLAALVDKQLEDDSQIPDDVQGLMRSASGKANLIVRERFRQFDELCEENLFPKKGKMTPGPADLAGFWDMVMIEVNSIFTSFRDLAKAAVKDWIMPPKKAAARPATASTTVRQSPRKSLPKKAVSAKRATPPSADSTNKGSRFRR